MPELTLILEDGTGKADANTYASVAQCDAYHLAHVSPAAWTGATETQKKAALAMATRVLDSGMEWKGNRNSDEQALAWPRSMAERRDGAGQRFIAPLGQFWPDNAVPKPLQDATCELARVLLGQDRTQDDPSKGIASIGLGQGAVAITFDKTDRKIALTDEVLRMLSDLGRPLGARSTVRVVRV